MRSKKEKERQRRLVSDFSSNFFLSSNRLQSNSFNPFVILQSLSISSIILFQSVPRESKFGPPISKATNLTILPLTLPAFSSSLSTGILSTFNAATILAQTGTGYLVDRMAFPIVMAISCASASLTAYLLLGFANTLPLIFIFVVLFGLVAGGFFATVSGGGPEIARRRNSPISRVIYSLMMVRGESISLPLFWILRRCSLVLCFSSSGLASITGPLIAASLYRSDLQGQSGGYGSHGFAPLVLFVGRWVSMIQLQKLWIAFFLSLADLRRFPTFPLPFLQWNGNLLHHFQLFPISQKDRDSRPIRQNQHPQFNSVDICTKTISRVNQKLSSPSSFFF